jgi:hypothetical protein
MPAPWSTRLPSCTLKDLNFCYSSPQSLVFLLQPPELTNTYPLTWCQKINDFKTLFLKKNSPGSCKSKIYIPPNIQLYRGRTGKPFMYCKQFLQLHYELYFVQPFWMTLRDLSLVVTRTSKACDHLPTRPGSCSPLLRVVHPFLREGWT